MLTRLFDGLTMLSIVVLLLSLTVRGIISAEVFTGLLAAATFLVVMARATNTGVIRLMFRIALPVVSLVAFLRIVSGGEQQRATAWLSVVMVLMMVVIGFSIMFGGLFPSRRRHR